MRLQWLKEISGTHVQAISVFEQLAGIGIGLRELNILVNTIKETAYENGFSESTAVNRFMDDVTQHYKSVGGFKFRLEELKSEIEDTEAGLTVLRQSDSFICCSLWFYIHCRKIHTVHHHKSTPSFVSGTR